MHPFKKTIILLLIAFLLIIIHFIHFPQISLARQDSFTKTAKAKSITKHSPNYHKSPEEEIPVETVQRGKINKWVWVGLGVLAAGVLAGAGGGGGGNGGSVNGGSVNGGSDSETPQESKTNIEVQWE